VRIVGGELRGRRLRAPRGAATRPTADRVKEAIFNILGTPPEGAKALDLFAGSGALGLEALSRGCQSAVFVERAEPALAALRENIAQLRVDDRARVLRDDASHAARRLFRAGERFTWIFLDPPYAGGQMDHALSAVSQVCANDGTVIAEHDVRHEPKSEVGELSRHDHRRYGDTCVSFYARAATPGAEPQP
jgi:16S rRNA (guanine(966)-N(2))-methyltransferase RsmD